MRRSKGQEEMEQGIDEIGGCQNSKTYYCDVNLEMKVWDRWEGTHCKGFFE